MYVFVLTFICYPGLALDSTIDFLASSGNYDSWHVLVIQATFNGMDAIGRFMGAVDCLMISNTNIKIQSAIRTIYLATFLLISFDVSPEWLF